MLSNSAVTVSLSDLLINNLPVIIDILSGVLMALAVWFARRYLAPYFKVEKSRRQAEFIAVIADDITDDLVRRYPDKEWVKKLDEAVDKIMDVCGIDGEIAQRAVSAAVSRKPGKEPV